MARIHPVIATLARARAERGLSCRDVAERAGIAHSTVQYTERWGRGATLPVLTAWAAALDLELVLAPARENDRRPGPPRPPRIGPAEQAEHRRALNAALTRAKRNAA